VDITEGQSIDHIIVSLKVCRTDYTFERYHAIKGNKIRIAGGSISSFIFGFDCGVQKLSER